MTTDSATPPAAPANGTLSPSDENPTDIVYGWAMFFIFVFAVLAISLAVCVLALRPSWWMLGVVYGTDLTVTAVVFKVVIGAFRSSSYPDLEEADKPAAARGATAPVKAGRAPVAAHH